MDNTKSKDRSLLVTILVMVSIILTLLLVMFSFVLVAVFDELSTNDSNSAEIESLPPELASEEDRAQLFSEFKLIYNSGDNEKLQSMFGEAYQLEFSDKDVEEQLNTLHTIAPNIKDGAYLHYEYEKLDNGLSQYHLVYNIITSVGLRKLRLSFIQQGNDPISMVAINIKSSY